MKEFFREILGENFSDEIFQKINEKIEETSKIETKKLELAHSKEIEQMKLQNAIDSAVSISGVKNQKALMALLDKEIIYFGDGGEIVGLDEQISSLKKSDSYLFESKEIKGLAPAQAAETVYKSPKEMNYQELCEYFDAKNA